MRPSKHTLTKSYTDTHIDNHSHSGSFYFTISNINQDTHNKETHTDTARDSDTGRHKQAHREQYTNRYSVIYVHSVSLTQEVATYMRNETMKNLR